MNLTLLRERQQPSHDCTLGLLLIPDASLTLCTMELPWVPSATCKGGTKGKSCIPLGVYKLVRHVSPTKYPKRTFALVNDDLDVLHYEGDDRDPDEDRATCLIHAANFARELLGCIALGGSHTKVGETYMVTSSRKAMDKFSAAVPWVDGHTLEIVEGM